MTRTRSAASPASHVAAARTSGSSGCTSVTTGMAPHCTVRAASIREFVSVNSPGPSTEPTGRISSPVGMMATMGCRATGSAAWPPAAAALRSAGVSRRPAAMSSSPAWKSSPLARTWRPRVTGPATRALPSGRSATRSRSTTVSVPAGMGSPVSIEVNAAADSTCWPASDAAPGTEAAATAMPSIAAQAKRGAAQRARAAAAATRPSASRTGTCSTTGSPCQPAAVHAATHWP